MDCNICLDKLRCLDLVRLLDCGHQFHNICFLRNEGATRCPMCRHLIVDTVTYCISNENFNFFELDSHMFNEQIEHINNSRDIIQKREYMDNLEVLEEKIKEQQDVIDKFFKEHLNFFKFKILKAVKTGNSCVDIYQSDYREEYENYGIIFLLKGVPGDTNYFRNKGIVSIVDKLYEYFSVQNIFIISDNTCRKNFIRVYI